MIALYDLLLYNPLFNALIWLYTFVALKDLGVAIILLTILIRVVLFPLFYKGFKNQTIMQKLQPILRQVQLKHKDNKEEQARQMMALYREHKVSPFSSFFLILLQLPVLIALYQVFSSGFADAALSGLYAFVPNPGHIPPSFLGLLDLSQKSIVIVVLAAAFQYWQGRLSLPKTALTAEDKADPTTAMSRNMVVMGPIITILIFSSFPAAIGLYWLTSSAFSVLQQWYINKKVYGGADSCEAKIAKLR